MANVIFKNPTLNDKYIVLGTDQTVRLPGGFHGPISEITDEKMIQGMIDRKSNLVALKPAPQPNLGTNKIA